MSSGIVFSIEEFAIHDGPGVRTTVFLKGCPLRCAWCHSPEGQDFLPEPIRSPNGCLSCGACMEAGLRESGTPTLVPHSAEVCPRHLIRMCGSKYTSDLLCKKLLKNADFWKASGGGVTFSGGEPLAQPDFLLECLKNLKGNAHRALQTCGYTSPVIFESVLSECDYVLYDLKLIDPMAHKHWCGVDNRNILQNYRTLAASGKEFITRVPLIPTVNDSPENLESTAHILHECGVGRVELLPYQSMTGSKYAMTGKKYAPPFDETLPPQPHTEIFQSYDIEVHIL